MMVGHPSKVAGTVATLLRKRQAKQRLLVVVMVSLMVLASLNKLRTVTMVAARVTVESAQLQAKLSGVKHTDAHSGDGKSSQAKGSKPDHTGSDMECSELYVHA